MSSVYLVNPSEREILKNAGDRMPLGLLYLAKSLENNGHSANIYDLNHVPETRLIREIMNHKPDLVGISCLTSPMVNETNRLAKEIKKWTNVKLVVGGYHPTIMPNDFQKFDYVIQGEGENALEQILVGSERIVRGNNVDLNKLGKPSRHLLNPNNYNMQMDGMRTATMITSRGCPNNCLFCGNMSRQVRYHKIEDIESELKEIKSAGYEAVYFLDDVFTINKERAKLIGTIAAANGLKYRVTTRANYTNRDLVGHLARTGCDVLSLGVESGNPEILERVGKNQTKAQIREAVSICADYGIKTKGFFIIGLPGETENTAQETIEFSKQLRVNGLTYADFYPLVPFPGTAIWDNPSKYGIKILDKDYSHYLQATREEPKIVCETNSLKAKRIGELLMEAKRSWKN